MGSTFRNTIGARLRRVLGRRSPSATSCERWQAQRTTDTLDGTGWVIDHYARQIDDGGVPEVAFDDARRRLMAYRVFPTGLMRAVVCACDGQVHEGTTIVQWVRVGPVTLEMAVRVLRVWDLIRGDVLDVGFTYATVEGHPERGIASISLRRDRQADRTTFVIDVRSQPGRLATRLGRPVARWFQRRATRAALVAFASATGSLPRSESGSQ